MGDDSLMSKTCEYCGAYSVITFADENDVTYSFNCECYDNLVIYDTFGTGKNYKNHCWSCKAKIDSRVCIRDQDHRYGYICNKCHKSLRDYFKNTV